MSREFVMGAVINMIDGFSNPVNHMSREADRFGESARRGGRGVDEFGRSADNSADELRRFTTGSRAANMGARGMAGGVASLTASMLGLNSIMGAAMGIMSFKVAYDWLVSSNAEMEQYQNTLAVVLGSSEKATQTLEWATKFARDTPFEVPQIVEATTRLATFGITAQKTLGNIGDMASVMGKPLMQAVEAIGDAQGGEVERLKEFGITKQMLIDQAEKMGTSVVNNAGQITDQQAFNAALFTLMEERYAGGMAMQAKSFKGMLSSVADFIGEMGREFGKPIFDRMKVGLANSLGFLDRIKADGTMEVITAKAQAFGLAVTDVFGSAFSIMGRLIGLVSDRVGAFLESNGSRFALIGGVIGNAFITLQSYAMPVLNWLVDQALPKVLDAMFLVGSVIVQTAAFFVDNWGHIAPFIEGIGISLGLVTAALGLVVGPLGLLVGIGYMVVQVTKAWAAAQAILNAVMMVNPVYLVIGAIGLLIGAGLWLVQNWEMVKERFAEFWPSMAAGALGPLGMLVSYVVGHFEQIKSYVVGLTGQAFTWGANIIDTMINGVMSAKDRLVGAFTQVFTAARQLMPFSDAREGPFSQLTYSGGAIISTMAEGVQGNAPVLHDAMLNAFSGLPTVGALSSTITAPSFSSSLPIAPQFSSAVPTTPTVTAASSVPTAATPTAQTSERSIHIEKLVDKLEISGVAKDAEQLANEILRIIHEKLSSADEVTTEGLGALL